MAKYFYKLILEYRGTHYNGWQIQPQVQTVQGELNKALSIISRSQDVKTMGSGRTDAGVHALGQVVKVEIPQFLGHEVLKKALNAHLPLDIRVKEVAASDPDFLPTVHAKSKEYHYLFTLGRSLSAFQHEMLANFPYDNLDLEKMKEACRILCGKHHFINFFCVGTEVSHYEREIYECEIHRVETPSEMFPPYYVFKIVGNGFLKQMVRLLMGAIWNVGRGKCGLEDLRQALTAEKRTKLGPVAPASGLYLVRVNY